MSQAALLPSVVLALAVAAPVVRMVQTPRCLKARREPGPGGAARAAFAATNLGPQQAQVWRLERQVVVLEPVVEPVDWQALQ